MYTTTTKTTSVTVGKFIELQYIANDDEPSQHWTNRHKTNRISLFYSLTGPGKLLPPNNRLNFRFLKNFVTMTMTSTVNFLVTQSIFSPHKIDKVSQQKFVSCNANVNTNLNEKWIHFNALRTSRVRWCKGQMRYVNITRVQRTQQRKK